MRNSKIFIPIFLICLCSILQSNIIFAKDAQTPMSGIEENVITESDAGGGDIKAWHVVLMVTIPVAVWLSIYLILAVIDYE